MDRLISQLPLSQRIPALADGIRSLRASTERNQKEEAEFLELLRQAETALRGSPEEAEGVTPSGLLDEPAPPKPTAKQKGEVHMAKDMR